MRRLFLVASLTLLMGMHDGRNGLAVAESASSRTCEGICDELSEGAWSVTVSPPTSGMVECTGPKSGRTKVSFPAGAIGLAETKVAPSPAGPLIEFRSAGPSVRISGSLDPGPLALRFELQDGGNGAIQCAGFLKKFKDPGGSEGWDAQSTCSSAKTGQAVCRLDPALQANLLIRRTLMEGARPE